MKILEQSEHINHEYCASIIEVGEIEPIPNSDFLASTKVNGQTIVVRRDLVKQGDLMFYAENETQLNERFLSVNNLFEQSEFDKNANAVQVGKLLTQLQLAKTNQDLEEVSRLESLIKENTGFFTKHRRVKMIRLRGVASSGFLFSIETMEKFCPEIVNINLKDYIGYDFDTVNGELFIKAYVPYIPPKKRIVREYTWSQNKIKRYDRMIPGQFFFHYDTQPLKKNFNLIKPDTEVIITTKIHGTSAIFANVLTKRPKQYSTPFGWLTNIVNKVCHSLPIKFQKIEYVYDTIYSSRHQIRNQYINENSTECYYKTDVWAEYNEILKGAIQEGMTVYGEIFGYETGLQKMFATGNYDYGCEVGHNKFMPYRITTTNEDGSKKEWEVDEVINWTKNLMNERPEIADRLFVLDVLFRGKLADFYPEVDTKNHWNENVLELLGKEKRFFMEKNEPLCHNKVPREGFVLRIVGDEIKEAFKLKTEAFFLLESKRIDKGEVDIEMMESTINDF